VPKLVLKHAVPQFKKRSELKIRRTSLCSVLRSDQHRRAADRSARFNVPLVITDHPGILKCDPIPVRRGEQHARLGFSTGASSHVVVRAMKNVIDVSADRVQQSTKSRMNLVERVSRKQTAGDPALVGNHNDQKPGLAKLPDGFRNAIEEPQIVWRRDIAT
jgi:hypothetical protein